jgi:mannose-6-phosphate isomerase-like protein (cupin superfamily)
MFDKVNLAEKLALFDDLWAPRTVGRFEGYELRIAKVKGEFTWHRHDLTDEFFYVVSGRLTIRLRDQKIELNAGELYVVPRGVEHQPYAEEEAHIFMIELAGTLNTGDENTAAPQREI